MERIIRVGLAGFGFSGRIFQAPFLTADPHYQLVRVYERTHERAKEEYPGVEVVHDFRALLAEDIDLVVLSLPNQEHAVRAREALLAGKHVITEKPAAASAEEVRALGKLAEEKGRIYSIYQNRRLDGDFLTVKKLLADGSLGELVDYSAHYDRYVTGQSPKDWKREEVPGVGLLYDIGVHLVDQIVSLFGAPKAVFADLRKQRQESTGSDRLTIFMYYDGFRAEATAGEVCADHDLHYAVYGRKGTFVKYGMDVQEAALIRGERPAGRADWGLDREADYGTLTTYEDGTFTRRRIPTERGNYGAYYENIYKVITEGAAPLVSLAEAETVLSVLEAAEKSSRLGARVALTGGKE